MKLVSPTEPGSLLAGKYRVERVLGVGGMGTVVAAMHDVLEQRVAIKVLNADALSRPDVVERFKREARAVARLKSQHAVRVLDVGALENHAPYMVMEYLQGQDLSSELAEHGPMPLSMAVGYVLQAAEAVAEAHSMRIVHRDLKPANLFLAQQPSGARSIKVLDFGIAKALDNTGKQAALTQTTAMMGTAYYMSPEQLTASREVDLRTDIWALGVTLYELCTGVLPFESDNLAEIIGLILQNRPTPPSTLRPDMPRGLEQIIQLCMQSSPNDRFQTITDMAAALAPFAPPEVQGNLQRIERMVPLSLDAGALRASIQPPPPSFQPAQSMSGSLQLPRPPRTGVTGVDRTVVDMAPAGAPLGHTRKMPGGMSMPMPAAPARGPAFAHTVALLDANPAPATGRVPGPPTAPAANRTGAVLAVATLCSLALVATVVLAAKSLRAPTDEPTSTVVAPPTSTVALPDEAPPAASSQTSQPPRVENLPAEPESPPRAAKSPRSPARPKAPSAQTPRANNDNPLQIDLK